MGLMAVASMGLDLTFDLLFEEVPACIHPVVLFGRLVGWFDRSWSTPRLVGTVVALGFPLGVAALAGVRARTYGPSLGELAVNRNTGGYSTSSGSISKDPFLMLSSVSG